MKNFTRFVVVLTCLFVSARSTAQNPWWTTTSGVGAPNNPANWGTKGQPSPTNTPGGRGDLSGWMDPTTGYYYIFGGTNTNQSLYNDLWQYIPASNSWIWIAGDSTAATRTPGIYGTRGVPAAANKPGGRTGHSGFADGKGNFWIFGGYGYDVNGNYALLNDLWRYHAGVWTWMGGDDTTNSRGNYATSGAESRANKPGARLFGSTWIDASGNVWLFGGKGYDANGNQGPLNDLWRFDTTSRRWAWVSGSSTNNQNGNYGEQYSASSQNTPGARYGQSVTVDASGNFWLFGGTSTPGSGIASPGYYNDLWKFTPAVQSFAINGSWTWVAGSDAVNQYGVYGQQGHYSPTNQPGARLGQALEIDNNGIIWVWGGYGIDADPDGFSDMNDLWEYNPTLQQWAWVGGSTLGSQPSSYTQLNSAAPTNVPSARSGFAYWMDRTNNLWITSGGSGAGTPSGGVGTWYDDVWFTPMADIDLSIQEVNLQGTPQGNDNLLTWETVNEINEAGFTVERSTNGASFTDIGSVPSAGNGNHQYSFTDDHLPVGISTFYYRLKEIDDHSDSVYSQTIALNDPATGTMSLYPNPATDGATLSLPANSPLLGTTASLFDIDGKLISQYRITGAQQFIDVHMLASGIYLLRLGNGQTLKLIKN